LLQRDEFRLAVTRSLDPCSSGRVYEEIVNLLSTRQRACTARRLTVVLLLGTTPAAVAACGVLDPGRCGVPQRDLSAWGQLGAPSATSPPTLFAQFDLVERQEDRGIVVLLSWGVMSASLKPHTTRAELRDAGGGSVIATLPLDQRTGVDIVTFGNGPYTWPVPVADLRTRLAAGRGRVELTTSLPDQGVVRVDLSSVRDSRTFERPYCS
jgi:hypothetical protein